MRSFAVLYITPALLFCCDPISSQQEKIHHQRQAIRLAMRFINRSVTDSEISPDECEWHGIQCTEIIITSIYFDTSAHIRFHMQWFPPDVRHIHLNCVDASLYWTTGDLPRELRYFSVTNCESPRHFIAMRRLPDFLEEFMFSAPSVCGDLDLRYLPETLQLIYISCTNEVFPAEVLYEPRSLPASLHHAFFLKPSAEKPVKLARLGSGRIHAKIRNAVSGDRRETTLLTRNSKYYQTFLKQFLLEASHVERVLCF